MPPTSTPKSGVAGPSSALDLPLHPDLGLVAERGRDVLLSADAKAPPPRQLPIDCRPASRHQALPRRPQRQPKTIRLDRIGSLDPDQARQTARPVRMSQSTSSVAASRLSARCLSFEPPSRVKLNARIANPHP